MGKQINYYMEYEAFLTIAMTAIDLGCQIVKEDFVTGKIISSSDISIITQDTNSYYFYIPEAAPLNIKVRTDGSEYVQSYNETGNAIIEAGFCRYNIDEAFIGRGRLFSQTGYYDQNGEFRTCPHRICVRIFEHNFVADKAKMCRRAGARQAFLTQSAAKFAEKTCVYAYVDRFLFTDRKLSMKYTSN